MSQLLAIDASTTSTGWAVFDGTKLIDYGCICPKDGPVIQRILHIANAIDNVLNQYTSINQIIMEEVLPKNDAYDDGASHHANPKVFKPLMWLQAAINFIIFVRHKSAKVEFIMPNSWRAKCGIKTGRGVRREELKKADQRFVQDQFGIKVNDDIADAIGIGFSQVKPQKAAFDWAE